MAMTQRNLHRNNWALGACALLSLLVMMAWLATATPTVTIDLANRNLVVGIRAPETHGAWSTGDTHITIPYGTDIAWRRVQFRWLQPPDSNLPVTMMSDAHIVITHPSAQWRTVAMLLAPAQTELVLQSPTTHVAGDRRPIGVLLADITVTLLRQPWWSRVAGGLDLWLPLGLVALLLRRSRWLGVLAYILLCGLYVTMIYQESRTGFGNPSLWLDRNGRHATCMVMLLALWRQYRPIVGGVVVPLPDQKRRLGLDVMRAIAVLCVVCAHFTPLVFAEWSANPALFRWTLYLGAVGVDIFFALSGYLIGGILLRTLTRIGEFAVVQRFWMRRWLRTLPAAYLSAIVVWFIAAPRNSADYLASIMFVGSVNPYHLASEHSFWWSLGAEELFYLLFPLLLFFLVKKLPARRALATTLLLFAGAAMLCRIGLQSWLPLQVVGNSEIVSYARLDCMVWGILIQWLRRERPALFTQLAQMGVAPGLVIAMVGVMLMLDQARWYMLALFAGHMLITIGAALIIPAFDAFVSFAWPPLNRLFAGIALVSYSAYLYNVMMQQWLSQQFGAATSWPMLIGLFGLYLAMTFVAATLSYRVVEAPLLRWRDRVYPE
jgi:peptidoglycan/LPS O-acetylase OafA/YrhL